MSDRAEEQWTTEEPDEQVERTSSSEKPLSTADVAHAGQTESNVHHLDPAREARLTNADPETTGVASGASRSTEMTHNGTTGPLFARNQADSLRSRWQTIQTSFVDEPRHAVEQADGLVATAIKQLAETFAEERAKLEDQWDKGEDISTEELRVALQRYRSFFDRLLAV
jgi:hypothetical protein